MRNFLVRWASVTVAVLVAAHLVPGIEYRGIGALLTASLLLGLVNAVLKPFLVILSLPLLLFSFGLFMLVINASLFYLVGHVVRGFSVSGWTAAFWGSLVCSVVSVLLKAFSPRGGVESGTKPGLRRPPGKGGRVIDV